MTFRWQVDVFASQYRLIVNNGADSTVFDNTYGTNICLGDTCEVSLTLDSGVYSWQVESRNAVGAVRTGVISFSCAVIRLAGLALGGQVPGALAHPGLMHNTGMTWVKYQIVWTTTPVTTVRDLIETGHGQGFKVLLSVTGPTYPDSIDFAGYVDYLRGVSTYRPEAIEVWNEMNLNTEWPAGQINPTTYIANMLAPAYLAIKENSPETIVISGALASTGVDDGIYVWSDARYARGMAQAGAAQYADCIGFHYNAGATSPRAVAGHPADAGDGHYSWYFGPTTEVYRRAFRSADPLCLTEIGFLSGEGYPPLPSDWFWAKGTTEADQAAWLGESVRYAREMGDIRLMIVWNVDFTTWTDDPKAGFAILRPDGSCPACAALHDALNQ